MSSAIEIVRLDLSAAQLRAVARKASDTKLARRVLAIPMVLEGHPRQVAAQAGAMDRQTLRDWVHRYNAHGQDGLTDQPRSGRPPRLTKAQEAEVEQWVIKGPDPKVDGVVRWRCVDLRDRIAARFKIDLHERSIGKLLDKLGFSRMSVRPLHREGDLEAQETFKKTSPSWRGPRYRQGSPAGPSRSGSKTKPESASKQGTLTRIWAERGTRPRIKRDHRFTWAYLFGAICPARGVGAALVMPWVNVEAMSLHLAEISQAVSPGTIALLVIDGAGWHTSPKLTLPDNIGLLQLPAYAPELNPTENVWQYMRGNWFANSAWDTYDAIVDACCDAWNAFAAKPALIYSIGNREWTRASN